MNRYTSLYIKQINNKDLLNSSGSYIQCLVITANGKNLTKICNMHVLYGFTMLCSLQVYSKAIQSYVTAL